MTVKIGDVAPDFTLPGTDSQDYTLSSYRGRPVVLVFYPGDNTPVCTTQLKSYTASFEDFDALDAQILAISPQSVKSHDDFSCKHEFKFPLLADVDKKVIKAYGVWGLKKFMGREYDGILRTTFIIDPKGKVAKVYDKVKTAGHAEEILKDIKALQG